MGKFGFNVKSIRETYEAPNDTEHKVVNVYIYKGHGNNIKD